MGAVLGVLVGILTVCVLILLTRTSSQTSAIRATQVTNTKNGHISQRTLDAILDCSTPGGKCYARSKSQYAKAVGDINRVVILASACSVGLNPHMKVADRQTAIQGCVITRLARQTAH